jgi:hypothetical protein
LVHLAIDNLSEWRPDKPPTSDKPDLVRFSPDFEGEGARSPEDCFVDDVLRAAEWARDQLDLEASALPRPDVEAELLQLQVLLETVVTKLRTLSRDVLNLLSIDLDPVDCADRNERCQVCIREASTKTKSLDTKMQAHRARAMIAHELAIRVLRVAHGYGMKIAASGSDGSGTYVSDAIKLLKLVGDHIGIKRQLLTWRGIVAKVKAEATESD